MYKQQRLKPKIFWYLRMSLTFNINHLLGGTDKQVDTCDTILQALVESGEQSKLIFEARVVFS